MTAPVLAFRDALLAALERGDRDAAVELLKEFGERTASAVAASDLDQIADLRAQAARLRRRVGRLDAEPMLAAYVTGQLQAFDVLLDHGRTATLLRRASEERQQMVIKQIADPSYVGNYSDAEVIEIYRKWAKGALDA